MHRVCLNTQYHHNSFIIHLNKLHIIWVFIHLIENTKNTRFYYKINHRLKTFINYSLYTVLSTVLLIIKLEFSDYFILQI